MGFVLSVVGTVIGFLVSLGVYLVVHVILVFGLAFALAYYVMGLVLKPLKLIFKLFTLPFRRKSDQEPLSN